MRVRACPRMRLPLVHAVRWAAWVPGVLCTTSNAVEPFLCLIVQDVWRSLLEQKIEWKTLMSSDSYIIFWEQRGVGNRGGGIIEDVLLRMVYYLEQTRAVLYVVVLNHSRVYPEEIVQHFTPFCVSHKYTQKNINVRFLTSTSNPCALS